MEKTHSKEETLAFIEYLRGKKNVVLDEQLIPWRTFFNFSIENTYHRAADMLEMIRKAKSAQYAYDAIAHDVAKQNCLWKTFPEGAYMFQEDWEEYQEACSGVLPEHVEKWAARSNGLASRNEIFVLFPTEYLLFRHRFESDADRRLTVTEVTLQGAYNGYRYRKREAEEMEKALANVIGHGERRMTLAFSAKESCLTASECIPAAKFLCEALGLDRICIMDRDADKVTVIKREAACPDTDPVSQVHRV